MFTTNDTKAIKKKAKMIMKANGFRLLLWNFFIILSTFSAAMSSSDASNVMQSGSTTVNVNPVLYVGGIFSILSLGATFSWLRLMKTENAAALSDTYTWREAFTGINSLKKVIQFFLLNLLIFFKLLVWIIPGLVVIILGLVVIILGSANDNLIAALLITGILLVIASYVMIIVKSFAYSQSTFIFHELLEKDEQNASKREAIKQSESLMDGEKMNYFVFSLSYLGWILGVVLISAFFSFMFYSNDFLQTIIYVVIYGLGMSLLQVYITAGQAGFYYVISKRKGKN